MVNNCLISNLKDNDISPKACNPVSEDVCKSGFMAPADKIILPYQEFTRALPVVAN